MRPLMSGTFVDRVQVVMACTVLLIRFAAIRMTTLPRSKIEAPIHFLQAAVLSGLCASRIGHFSRISWLPVPQKLN